MLQRWAMCTSSLGKTHPGAVPRMHRALLVERRALTACMEVVGRLARLVLVLPPLLRVVLRLAVVLVVVVLLLCLVAVRLVVASERAESS